MATEDRLKIEITKSGYQAAIDNSSDAKGFKIRISEAAVYDKDNKMRGRFGVVGKNVGQQQISLRTVVRDKVNSYGIKTIKLIDEYSGVDFAIITHPKDEMIDYVNPHKSAYIICNLILSSLEGGTVTIVDSSSVDADYGMLESQIADINDKLTKLPGVNLPGNQDTSGNANTATKLQTPRKIGGIDFDGTSDIHLPISGKYIPTEKYEAGDLVKVDGEWYECYHPDGCKGKDPRDPKNRPAGWQNTDQSQPYYWLKIGRWLSFPETGSPIYLPTTAVREGLIKYRNDGNLHKDKFWRLAELYPNLISNNLINIADLRGEFLRGLDDGRGIDNNRTINSWQRYQILNHIHGIQGWTGDSSMLVSKNGSLNKLGGVSVTKGDGGIINTDKTGQQVDPSWRMISTDNIPNRAEEVGAEVRPRNVAMLIATRI